MPTVRNKQGEEFDVTDADAASMSAADPSLSIVGDLRVAPDEAGNAPVSMPATSVTNQVGHAPASVADQSAYAHRQALSEKTSTAGAAVRGFGSGLTFGVSDRLSDPETIEADEAVHGTARLGGTIVGALAPAAFGDEAGLLGLGGKAAIADDALTAERAASSISSKMLFGGEAAAGGKLERGLAKANAALAEGGEAARAADASVGLEGLDAKALRGEHQAELGRIEAGRVPERQALADDLATFRAQAKDDKLFLTTKGIKEDGMNVLGKRTLKADRALDSLLDNPIQLAAKPERALGSLQQQQAALEGIMAKSDTLKATFAADTSGERMAALEKIPQALEQNRALQTRIAQLTAEPASARLSAIADAKDALTAGSGPKSMAEQMLGGSVFSGVAGFLHALPGVGSMLAPLAGAKASKLVTDLVFRGVGKATAAAGAKTADVVKRFLGAAIRTPQVPVLATRTLASVAFGPPEKPSRAAPKAAKKPELAELHEKVTGQLKQLTAYDETGTPRMRPEARQAMGAQLAGIRALSPKLADRMETSFATRVEYLAGQIPREPDMGVMQIGPHKSVTSDLEMRSFARKVAAVEDPEGVEERLVHGTITPEDVEAYHAVYPARAEHLKQTLIEQLPTLRQTLPYNRRLALSMFSGVPVDPSMHPAVLAVLQGHFANEEGSEGGTQAPTPQPAFGSVRADIGTASQQREGAIK